MLASDSGAQRDGRLYHDIDAVRPSRGDWIQLLHSSPGAKQDDETLYSTEYSYEYTRMPPGLRYLL